MTWGKIIGIDEHFTTGDKWLAGGLFGWSMLWFGVFVVGTVWNLIAPWPISVWSHFWFVVGIGIPVAFTLITACGSPGEECAICICFSGDSGKDGRTPSTMAWSSIITTSPNPDANGVSSCVSSRTTHPFVGNGAWVTPSICGKKYR